MNTSRQIYSSTQLQHWIWHALTNIEAKPTLKEFMSPAVLRSREFWYACVGWERASKNWIIVIRFDIGSRSLKWQIIGVLSQPQFCTEMCYNIIMFVISWYLDMKNTKDKKLTTFCLHLFAV